MKILFTCAGRRNYLIEYFKKINGIQVLACDADSNAPALYEADEWFIVPLISDKNYISYLLKESYQREIDAIISLNDIELPLLAENSHLFIEKSIKVVVSEKEVIDICFDKYKTFEFSKCLPVSTIPTFLTPDKAIEFQKQNPKCKFIVKPRWGSASIGIEYPNSIGELEYLFQKVRRTIGLSVLGGNHDQMIDNSVIIQKRIFGQEYGIDVVNNLRGEYMGTMIRKKISMRSGETDRAITVYNKGIAEIGRIISEKLRHIGNLDCDLFIEGESIYLLEMNPRFGGGYPFMHIAGANLPLGLVYCLKEEVPPDGILDYKEGVISAKVDRLVRISNR